jgi:hypothetical protein
MPNILTHLIGYEIASKAIFIVMLLLSGYLGILIARSIARITVLDSTRVCLLETVGIVFFLINPFAYERMMVQPMIYLGIIFLGYMIYYLCFIDRIIITGLYAGLALAMMPHAAYMILLIY